MSDGIVERIRAKYGLPVPPEPEVIDYSAYVELPLTLEARRLFLDGNSVIIERPSRAEYLSRILDKMNDDKDNSVGQCWYRSLYERRTA